MILSLNGLPAHQIGDDNWRDYVPDNEYRVKDNQGNEHFTGCLPVEDWDVASMATRPFESTGIVLYDEREIKERLEDMWRAKASLMHLGYQFDSLNQSRGTCWIHGTCGAAALMFAQANLPYRVPSPASVAYHCYTNFGVNGGYPTLGVQKFQQHGAAHVGLWPENGHNRNMDTAATRANRPFQWLEEVVETGSGEAGFWRTMSAICQGFPVGWSFSWWRHYVYGCWGRVENGEVKGGLRNSWGNNGYGDKGFGLLSGSRKYPSWSCVFLRMRQSPGAM
jgi:hypothetical protein